MTDLYVVGTVIIGMFGWVMWVRERGRSRDYATDLMQVIHDYPESTDSLRRSLKWDEIKERVEQ